LIDPSPRLNENSDEKEYDEAVRLFDNGYFKEAIIHLMKAVEIKGPHYVDSLYVIGLAYYNLGQFSESIKYYNETTKQNPKSRDAWYNLGLAYYDNKDYQNALMSYNKALDLREDHQLWLNKGLSEQQLHQKDNALVSYEKSIEISPKYAAAWYNKGFLLYSYYDNRFREAIKSFEKAVEYEPNYDNAWYYMGKSYYELKEFEDAVRCFKQSIRIDPRKKDSYEGIGLSYSSLAKDQEARYYTNLSRNIEKEKLDFTIEHGPPEVLTDLWTSKDRLNYVIYVNTITKILFTLKETPFAISVQAPWGAGKTSLMRMIQQKVDIDANDPRPEKYGILAYSRLRELKHELKKIIKESEVTSKRKDTNNGSIHEEQIVKLQEKNSDNRRKSFVTIWFNPWEYESTEHLWAGLADTIIREILNRMPQPRKDLFLLQLNLKIFNLEDLHKWIKSYILGQVWNKLRPWIFVTAGGLVASALAILAGSIPGSNPNFSTAGLFGFVLTTLQASINYFKNQKEMENLSTGFALTEYLHVPDYSTKLGKTHEAMEDIKRVLTAIPTQYKPLILFIDDLDRCTPNNIAHLFEGINQFISRNFQDCIFVIGTDNQVVASSLDVIYEDVIEKLPEYLVQSQVGWRYLEKFIQMSILIPPTSEEKFRKYIGSLVSTKEYFDEIKKVNHKISSSGANYRNEKTGDQIATDIENLSKAASNFSKNPRDVKRFVNLVTYYIYLHSEIKQMSPTSNLPSYEQIRRWIILILKWPSLAQWLYWTRNTLSYSLPSDFLDSTADKLRLLESLALESKDQKEWEERLSLELNFSEPKSIPWIKDNSVREFFRDEKNQPEWLKISDGAGLGVY